MYQLYRYKGNGIFGSKEQVCVFVSTKTPGCLRHRANLPFAPVGCKREKQISKENRIKCTKIMSDITIERCISLAIYLNTSVSRYIDIKPYNNLHSFRTGYLHSYISRYIVTKNIQCPTAKSGRSKRKSGAPDFFRLPCGTELFLVYRWYTLPSRLMQNINKKYTSLYTLVIKEWDYE